MRPETDCPVCRREHIPDDRERCPQCDSDLTCFRVLETLLEPEAQTAEPALPETNPQMTKTANKRTSLFFAVSGLLLGALTIMLGLQVYWITDLQSGVLEQQSVFSDAFSRMGFRLDRISEHQEKVFMQAAAQIENLRDQVMCTFFFSLFSPHEILRPQIENPTISRNKNGGGVCTFWDIPYNVNRRPIGIF